jgi:hypothetical protein
MATPLQPWCKRRSRRQPWKGAAAVQLPGGGGGWVCHVAPPALLSCLSAPALRPRQTPPQRQDPCRMRRVTKMGQLFRTSILCVPVALACDPAICSLACSSRYGPPDQLPLPVVGWPVDGRPMQNTSFHPGCICMTCNNATRHIASQPHMQHDTSRPQCQQHDADIRHPVRGPLPASL